MASLTEPAFDPNPVDFELVFGLARVEAMTDERVPCAAPRAALRARKDDLVEVREVILDSAAKIQYDGHLFVGTRLAGRAAKLNPVGRVSPFWQSDGPDYSISPSSANPHARRLPSTKQKAALNGRPAVAWRPHPHADLQPIRPFQAISLSIFAAADSMRSACISCLLRLLDTLLSVTGREVNSNGDVTSLFKMQTDDAGHEIATGAVKSMVW